MPAQACHRVTLTLSAWRVAVLRAAVAVAVVTRSRRLARFILDHGAEFAVRGARITVALLLALLLPACFSAPIDRAADRADAVVDRAAASARQIAQDATTALDARMAALTADLAARADAARAAALVDVDARLQRTRVEVVADVKAVVADADVRVERVVANVDARLEHHSAEWGKRVDAALAESAAWRAQVAPVLAAVSGGAGGSAPGPSPAAPDPDGQLALWTSLGVGAFTLGKTGLRLWRAHKATEPAS